MMRAGSRPGHSQQERDIRAPNYQKQTPHEFELVFEIAMATATPFNL